MKVLAEGVASDPAIKSWFVLQLQQGFINQQGVNLSKTMQNVECEFSGVRCFVTFELKWFGVFLAENFHLTERSSKSV